MAFIESFSYSTHFLSFNKISSFVNQSNLLLTRMQVDSVSSRPCEALCLKIFLKPIVMLTFLHTTCLRKEEAWNTLSSSIKFSNHGKYSSTSATTVHTCMTSSSRPLLSSKLSTKNAWRWPLFSLLSITKEKTTTSLRLYTEPSRATRTGIVLLLRRSQKTRRQACLGQSTT